MTTVVMLKSKMMLKGAEVLEQQMGRGDVFSPIELAGGPSQQLASRSSSAARHFGSEVVGFWLGYGGAFAKLPSDLETPIFKAITHSNQSIIFFIFVSLTPIGGLLSSLSPAVAAYRLPISEPRKVPYTAIVSNEQVLSRMPIVFILEPKKAARASCLFHHSSIIIPLSTSTHLGDGYYYACSQYINP